MDNEEDFYDFIKKNIKELRSKAEKLFNVKAFTSGGYDLWNTITVNHYVFDVNYYSGDYSLDYSTTIYSVLNNQIVTELSYLL